jgi:hypothetical protein
MQRRLFGRIPDGRILAGSLLIAGAIALLSPGAALAAPADDPVDLDGAYVLDRAGVLGGDTSSVREAIDRLFDERGTQLFVVYVDEFTGTSSDQDWANETAIRSGLGDRDILLAIATDERVYRYSVAEAFPLTDEQLDAVAADTIVPALRSDDWAGGAIAFADGLSAAQAPSPVPLIVGGVLAAGVGTVLIARGVRRRNAKKRVQDAAAADSKTLELRAGTLLVELDDALKTSEQELGFAQAQFGEDQTRDFSAALAEAKATAKQAFELRQKLDDAFPETPEQHRAMTLQLIELAERADATLDAQADAFDKLRRLDRNAPEVLESLVKDQATLEARIDAASETLERLAAQYPDADLRTVAGVPAQARKLTGFAKTAVEKARAELAKPKGDAAVAVRAAQQAVGQVLQLLASVDTLASDLAAQGELRTRAAAELEQQLQRSRSQVSAAQEYITTHRGAVGTAARTRISEAGRHLEAALALAAGDPGQALTEAQEADRLAVAAIQAARADVADYERGSESRDDRDADVPAYEEADSAGLGGILSDLFFGSGSGSPVRPSSGSWSWGSGSGGGWSSSKPSGFGGSSRRPSSTFRRSSGSSSRSSGGRRGGGGRF